MEVQFFVQTAAFAAVGVVIVQQILKLKFIPVGFANKYPVPTNIALSLIAALLAVWNENIVQPITWGGWLVLVTTIAVTAAIIYNQLLKNWEELRATEGKGAK